MMGAKPLFLSGCLAASTWGATPFKVDFAQAGSPVIVLSAEENLQIPDLRNIQVEGYDVDQATLIEEGDSLALNPLVLDLTAKDAPKVREVLPSQQKLVLEAPLFFVPRHGHVLADTAFGGLLCRIIQAMPEGGSVGVTRRWMVKYEPASVEDVFLSADLAFASTLDMSLTAADSLETGTALGLGSDSAVASAQVRFGWEQSRILLKPEFTGRIRLRRGKMETFHLGLKGMAEASGKFHLDLSGQGQYSWERVLPNFQYATIPLGHGVQISAKHQPVIGFYAKAEDSSLVGHTRFRLRQEIKSGFPAKANQAPFGDAKLSHELTPGDSASGSGMMRFQVRSLVSVHLGASDSHRLTLVHEATSTQEGIPPAWLPGAKFDPHGKSEKDPEKGLKGSLLAKTGFSAMKWQRQVKLGGSLSLEQRLDSSSATRGWLVYNRELPLLAPPKGVTAQIVRQEGQRLTVVGLAQTRVDWYSVQAQTADGAWVSWVDRAVGPRFRLPDLAGGQPLRLRILAGNAYGLSTPWPLEGLVLPSPNRPPHVPHTLLPAEGAVADTSLRLSWTGGDPDSGQQTQYRLFLGTRNAPMSPVGPYQAESGWVADGLKPGTTYFWKVRAWDGIDSVESPVLSFTTFATQEKAPVLPMLAKARSTGGNPWIYLPRGSFLRDDQAKITVGAFFMQKFEVTQAEFEKIMGVNPSYRLQDSLPVDKVTWEEARNFCQAIGGRLPTEAEWEYAGLGGSGDIPWLKDRAREYAWFRDNSDGRTRKVGQLKPNGFGLYDMAGNVFEWVEDWYAPYDPHALENPAGPGDGTTKVIRGASWYSEEANLSPRSRFFNRPGFRNYKVGFRCAEDALTETTTAGNTPVPEAN